VHLHHHAVRLAARVGLGLGDDLFLIDLVDSLAAILERRAGVFPLVLEELGVDVALDDKGIPGAWEDEGMGLWMSVRAHNRWRGRWSKHV